MQDNFEVTTNAYRENLYAKIKNTLIYSTFVFMEDAIQTHEILKKHGEFLDEESKSKILQNYVKNTIHSVEIIDQDRDGSFFNVTIYLIKGICEIALSVSYNKMHKGFIGNQLYFSHPLNSAPSDEHEKIEIKQDFMFEGGKVLRLSICNKLIQQFEDMLVESHPDFQIIRETPKES